MKKMIFGLMAFWWGLPLLLFAQMNNVELNGYVKYMYSSMKLPYFQERLDDHLLHARLNSHWYPNESLMAALEFRLRGFYGEALEKIPNYKYQIEHEYGEDKGLDAVLWNEQKSFGYAQVDRFYLDYTRGKMELTLGRQRIAWGTALVWNIVDLFNPLSILDFDYEERPGTDAIRCQYYTGAISRLDFAVKPGEDRYHRTFAGLASVNVSGYDLSVIVALHNDRKVLGATWAGSVGGAGFRGEIKISDPPHKPNDLGYPIFSFFGPSFWDDRATVTNFVLSGDYMFPNSFYIHTEVLYNSNGKEKYAGAFWDQARKVSMLSPARWSIYQEFAYEVHPLVRTSIFGIYNPDDRSSIVMPTITWSVEENLDLMVVAYLTDGEPLTEWGSFGKAGFVRLKYSF